MLFSPARLPCEVILNTLHGSLRPPVLLNPYRSIFLARRNAASTASSTPTAPRKAKPTASSSENKAAKRRRERETAAKRIAAAPSSTDFDPSKALFFYNGKIEQAGQAGRYLDAIRVAREIDRLQLRPNRITYLYLIRAMVSAGCHEEATVLFNEMAAREDMKPDVDICNEMLKAWATTGELPWQVLDYMSENRIKLNSASHEHLLTRACANADLEWAILQTNTLPTALQPGSAAQERLIRLAAGNVEEPALASGLLKQLVARSGASTSVETLADVLRAAARHRVAGLTGDLWRRVVHERSHTMDEGTCLDVLVTAGLNGDVPLARDVLKSLETIQITLGEQHLVPIVDAHLRSGEIAEAIKFVAWMREEGGDALVTFDGVGRSFTSFVFGQAVKKGETTSEKQFELLRSRLLSVAPVDPVILDALVYCAAQALDLPLARRLLAEAFSYLGGDTSASPYAFSLVINLALAGNFPDVASQTLESARRAGIPLSSSQHLLESSLRLSLTSGDDAPPSREACSEAIQLLQDIKALPNGTGRPSEETYHRLLSGLHAAADPRLEPVAVEAAKLGHRMTLVDMKHWPMRLQKKLTQRMSPGERKWAIKRLSDINDVEQEKRNKL